MTGTDRKALLALVLAAVVLFALWPLGPRVRRRPAAPVKVSSQQPAGPTYCPPTPTPVATATAPVRPAATTDGPLKLDNLSMHKLDLDTSKDFIETSVIVDRTMSDKEDAARMFSQALTKNQQSFPVGLSLAVLSLGPVLDSPDQFTAESFTRKGDTLTLNIVYTNVRLRGAQLRRNICWRPIMAVPLNIPANEAGKLKLVVTWTALESIPDGKPLHEVKPRTDELLFEIGMPAAPEAKSATPRRTDF